MLETTEKSQFNMAIASLERFNHILIDAYMNYRKGKMYEWFFCLKGLKMQIISKLKPEERKELFKIEQEIISNDKIKAIRKDDNILEDDKERMINNILIPIIEIYNERLQDLMAERGLLLPDKIDDSIFA